VRSRFHAEKVQVEGHPIYCPFMILGTGIDFVSVARMGRFFNRHQQRGLKRLFTDGEQAYCLGLSNPLPSLAARFAAKEAFYKAAGSGVGRVGGWLDVEVIRLGSGRPVLCLHGQAAVFAQESHVHKIHLSLSHTDELAAATVLLEG
jgi:holo-[acyl-carrier protein] synthase